MLIISFSMKAIVSVLLFLPELMYKVVKLYIIECFSPLSFHLHCSGFCNHYFGCYDHFSWPGLVLSQYKWSFLVVSCSFSNLFSGAVVFIHCVVVLNMLLQSFWYVCFFLFLSLSFYPSCSLFLCSFFDLFNFFLLFLSFHVSYCLWSLQSPLFWFLG
jgi:hypothetical protein